MESNVKRRFILQWHITHRCNLRCSHCYQRDYSAFSPEEDINRVLGQFQELLNAYDFCGHLNITGGEPLLHPGLFGLLGEARQRGMTAAVLTNGTLIGRDEARRLKAAGVLYVQVSLDGTEKTHDKIRGRGSFEQACQGIAALKAQGIHTSVSFTAQKNNLRELGKLSEICSCYGADALWFDRVVIPSGEDSQRLSLSDGEYERLCKKAAGLSKKGTVTCGRALQFLPCREKYIYHCSAGDTLLALLADGSVMPCRRLPLVAGNINENTLLNIYRESPVLQALRSAGIPEECISCGYKELCRGGSKCIAYARYNDFSRPDPDCPLIKKSALRP